MIMELNVVEIQVKNFEKSVEWYKQLFKLVHKEEEFAMFNTGKAILALWKGRKNKTALYFRTGNIKATHESLKNKGIKVSPVRKVHWGRKFYFSDPEGNKHFIYEE